MRHLIRITFVGGPIVIAMAMAFLFFILPQLIQEKLATRIRERHGLALEVNGGAGISLANGLAVTLGGVTLSDPNASGVPLANISSVTVPTPLSSVFSGEGLRKAILEDAIFSFESTADALPSDSGTVTPETVKPAAKPFAIELRNAALKAVDKAHNLSISVTDITGEVALGEDGTLAAQLLGLLNGAATTLDLTIDDVVRLRHKGSPADVRLASGESQVVLSGRLGMARDLTFDGSVAAESPDVRRFLKVLGLDLKGFAAATPVALDAGLSISKSRASFNNLAFSLGAMQAKGVIDIQAASPRPQVKADLAFNAIDINAYRAVPKATPATAPLDLAPNLQKDWSEQPFDLSDLKALDAGIILTADSFTAGAITTGAVTLKANLVDGGLTAEVATDALHGGKGQLKLTLAQAETAKLALDFSTENTDAKAFLTEAFGVTFLNGPVNLSAALTAEGQSPAQLVSTLAGAATLTLGNGSIAGLDLAVLAGLVARDDAEGWGMAAKAATTLTSAKASATFGDGIATLKDTYMQAAGLGLSVTGNVDLLRRAIDLQAQPSTGGGTTFPVAIRARGPWDKPKLTAKLEADDLSDEIEDVAKDAAKKAKKALKKLFDN